MTPTLEIAGENTLGAAASRALLYFVLILLAALFAVPALVMIMTSLRPTSEIASGALLSFPREVTVDAWVKAWTTACIGTRCEGLQASFLNSVMATVPVVLLTTVLGAINGFALTKMKFRGADAIFTMIWLGCFIPYQAVLIPIAQTLGAMRLSGSTYGLWVVYTAYSIPFTTLFFRNYYTTIPDELVRSAKIDGAGFFRTFWHIILPISPPMIVVSLIFQFTSIWNEFLFAASFTSGGAQTITVSLNNLVNTTFGAKEYNVDMAGALITSLPTLLVYILAGRYFMRGLTAGSVKG